MSLGDDRIPPPPPLPAPKIFSKVYRKIILKFIFVSTFQKYIWKLFWNLFLPLLFKSIYENKFQNNFHIYFWKYFWGWEWGVGLDPIVTKRRREVEKMDSWDQSNALVVDRFWWSGSMIVRSELRLAHSTDLANPFFRPSRVARWRSDPHLHPPKLFWKVEGKINLKSRGENKFQK